MLPENGEAAFRPREHHAVVAAPAGHTGVIAPDGGAVPHAGTRVRPAGCRAVHLRAASTRPLDTATRRPASRDPRGGRPLDEGQ
ncbi:hypothetical protein [Streptomyces sp. NPDC093600]|uniref:hypothetical protein n=1 Tax=Streptomyces sp. NPDC093600 TaxID=3366047 RepID=UPI00381D6F96